MEDDEQSGESAGQRSRPTVRIYGRPADHYSGQEDTAWKRFLGKYLPWVQKKLSQAERLAEAKVRQEEEKIHDIRAGREEKEASAVEKRANALSKVVDAVNQMNQLNENDELNRSALTPEQVELLLNELKADYQHLSEEHEFKLTAVDDDSEAGRS